MALTGKPGAWTRGKLVLFLGLLFVALALPAAILFYQAESRLQWEAFHQLRTSAEELAVRVDDRLAGLIAKEEERSFEEYSFFQVTGGKSNLLQLSPLSQYPVKSELPGMVGHFQVDSRGAFDTPLLPSPDEPNPFGFSPGEQKERVRLKEKIRRTLSQNRLVSSATGEGNRRYLPPSPSSKEYRSSFTRKREGSPASSLQKMSPQKALSPAGGVDEEESLAVEMAEEPFRSQEAFDQLGQAAPQEIFPGTLSQSKAKVKDLKLDDSFVARSRGLEEKRKQSPPGMGKSPVKKSAISKSDRRKRKVQVAIPERAALLAGRDSSSPTYPSSLRVRTFEGEIDPLQFRLLDSGEFVLFRKVWKEGQHFVQGMLLEQEPFLEGGLATPFQATSLSRGSRLLVAYKGDVLQTVGGEERPSYFENPDSLEGALLYRTPLSAPLNHLELIFTVTHLPRGPGSDLIRWSAMALFLVLFLGFYGLYRMGAGQIRLAAQQQDFVSAVSHELKTPLTSIRMYGEILREGWADEEKKKGYYDFIFHESERLSRLISNVLQLARLSRKGFTMEPKKMAVGELIALVESKIASQVEGAGFTLELEKEMEEKGDLLFVDSDAFVRIFINLVDNAVKFSGKAEKKVIHIEAEKKRGELHFLIRDYGPGIPRGQIKKIFQLFYRPQNELTRETVGTGIGLALVRQMVGRMNGKIDVRNREPGAEFRLSFPLEK